MDFSFYLVNLYPFTALVCACAFYRATARNATHGIVVAILSVCQVRVL